MVRNIIRRMILSAAGIAGVYLGLVRPWHVRWGTTEEERTTTLLGDELVAVPKLHTTRAITIHAPASSVWAWLVQIGQGRGGFYSYDWLENLAGADIHTVDEIRPDLQHLAEGDLVRLAPTPEPAMTVAHVEPEQALVLYAGVDMQTGAFVDVGTSLPAAYTVASWAFVLREIDAGTTRLIARFRLDWSASLMNAILWRVFVEPAHFIMERKMLLELKARAERAAPPAASTLLDRYMPTADVAIRFETIVDAPPEETYAAAKRVDELMATEPVVLALSEIRLLPERLRRRFGGNGGATPAAEAPVEEAPFVLLDEVSNREYVVGLVGQFWASDAGMLPIAPEEFTAFNRPGYAKTAFNFAVVPYGTNQTLLSTETRVATTDAEAQTQFARYWRLIGTGARLLMRRLLARIKAKAERRHETTPQAS